MSFFASAFSKLGSRLQGLSVKNSMTVLGFESIEGYHRLRLYTNNPPMGHVFFQEITWGSSLIKTSYSLYSAPSTVHINVLHTVSLLILASIVVACQGAGVSPTG